MDALLLALATEDTHCRVDDVNALTCGDLETILVEDLVGENAAELRIVRVVEEPRTDVGATQERRREEETRPETSRAKTASTKIGKTG